MAVASFSGGKETRVDAWWPLGLIAFGIACILFVALYNPTY